MTVDNHVRTLALFVVFGGVLFLLACVTCMATFCGCCDVDIKTKSEENDENDAEGKYISACGKLHKFDSTKSDSRKNEVCIEMESQHCKSESQVLSSGLSSPVAVLSPTKTPEIRRKSVNRPKVSPPPAPRKLRMKR